MCLRIAPLSRPQRRASEAVLRRYGGDAAVVVGITQPRKKRVRERSSPKQRTRVLRPAPRTSQPTTSKRPPPTASSSAPADLTSKTDPPGPPGLTKRDPIRRLRRVARCRITGRLILRWLGRFQFNGTRTRAH